MLDARETNSGSNPQNQDSQGIGEITPHTPPEAFVQQSSVLEANEAWLGQLRVAVIPLPPLPWTVLEVPSQAGTTFTPSANALSQQERIPQALPSRLKLKPSILLRIPPCSQLRLRYRDDTIPCSRKFLSFSARRTFPNHRALF